MPHALSGEGLARKGGKLERNSTQRKLPLFRCFFLSLLQILFGTQRM